ncbi:hypothetical protein, partial [Halalkalibacter hemicellulosilyticus]|uniref:hypothetical protein n=1 Tax=Halalkalibacter hemicellulosilyticus TaxID=127886 RepID=UPI000ADC9806
GHLKVYYERGKIYFHDKEQGVFGYTNYDEILWEKVQSVNWRVIWGKPNSKGQRKGYIGTYSKKLGKYNKLHQVVMIHWYGLEVLIEAYEKDFIVEHMDNNSFDCTIENLSFAPNNVNIAKGQTYDIERVEALPIAAINKYKDFETGKYQITVGFNNWVVKKTEEGLIPMNAIRLVYEDDYRRTFMDAQDILYELTTNGIINPEKLNHIYMEEEPAVLYEFKEGENRSGVIEVDGKMHIILDEHTRLIKVAPNKELYKGDF